MVIIIEKPNLSKSFIEKYPNKYPCTLSIVKYNKNNLLTKVELYILNICIAIMPDNNVPTKVKILKICKIIVSVQGI